MLSTMKIWIKYLVAALLGALIGWLVPPGNRQETARILSSLCVDAGRYIVFPLMFFTLPVAILELGDEGKFGSTLGRASVLSLVSIPVFTLAGIITALIVNPGRLPLAMETAAHASIRPLREILSELLPSNAFFVMLKGEFILPLILLGIVLGIGFAYDKGVTKPVVGFFDSFSHILYQVNSLVVEILPVFIIIITAANMTLVKTIPNLKVYGGLFLAVGLESLFVLLVGLPVFLYFLCGQKKPYRVLYALIAPSLAALVSGNLGFPLGALLKHDKESLGIRRRTGALAAPIAMSIGRAGTAMITATAFVLVLNSYSHLGLGPGAILWLLLFASIASILLGASPGAGPVTALVYLCGLYGKGFESGYLLVIPVAFPLLAIGVFVDTAWAGCVAFHTGFKNGHVVQRDIKHFI